MLREPKWRAFTAIAMSFITVVVSSSFAFLVLSAISNDFDVTLKIVGWVVIVESLIIAAVLLPFGGIADLVGDKLVLMVGLAVFSVGTLLTGLAPSFALLIGARVVASIGTALVLAVGTGMLVGAFPPEERGEALGAQASAVSVGAASAPLLGGVGLEFLSWETMFMLLVIPSLITLVAVYKLIDGDARPDDHRQHLDPVGGVLSALTITILILTITNPLDSELFSPATLGAIALTVVLGTAFVRWELHTNEPMIELRLFAVSVFRIATIVRILSFMAAITISLLLPVFLLSFRQTSAVITGVILALFAIGIGLSAPVSGQMYDRVGPRLPTLIGLGLQVAMSLVLAFSTESTSLFVIGAAAGVNGLAFGLWNVAGNSAILSATPPKLFGVGGAFTSVTRTLGNVSGQAISTVVVASVMASRGFDIPLGDLPQNLDAGSAFNDGWQIAFFITAGISVAALAIAMLLPAKSSVEESAEMSVDT